MKNRIGNYKIDDKVYAKFRSEIERWIENGWLKKTTETESGIIPLLTVVQTKKNKVRPVLDFREMNDFVECSGADADVCDEKLRQWRQKTSNCALLDLRDAYIQIIVDKKCSKYQIVKFENKFYELCQLGFGLNCAPEIMKAVVSKVLSLDDTIRAATDHYYDDIIVDLNVTSVERVQEHLLKYGLVCKPSEQLSTARVLGLQLSEEKDGLYWRRPDEDWEVDILDTLTRRQMFSLCGKITGHYPVAGWLRVALSFIKRS